MTNIRETAVESARAVAQKIWEDSFDHGRTAYYVERDGSITRDYFVGNFHERESVYFSHDGHALRAMTVGLNGVGYNGDVEDYSNDGGETTCDWRERDVDNPSDPLVEFIENIEPGFFAGET